MRWGFGVLDLTHVRRSSAPSPLRATRRGRPRGGGVEEDPHRSQGSMIRSPSCIWGALLLALGSRRSRWGF